MAYNPNINQNIRFEIKPMLYKKAIIKKEGFWITNFPEEFCKEWRTIADKTFYKLSQLKNEALGIATEEVNEESTQVNDESDTEQINDNDNSKQEPTETEQIQ